MKKLIMILSISVSLFSCSGINDKPASEETGVDSIATRIDSLSNENDKAAFAEDPANETMRQIMSTLMASKQQINLLESEISDSLTRSGLPPERRSLFSKTIQQLESSSQLINKQIEQIVFTDLQANKEKLSQIISKMKVSEKGLEGMVVKLDKITNYMQIASGLLQTLVPLTGVTSHGRER